MGSLTTPDNQLAILKHAKELVAQAKTVDEAKLLRDKAQAIQHYVKQQGYALEMQQDAGEFKLRAERKLGELLAETVERGRPAKMSHRGTILPDGVTRNQSYRCQRLASLPEADFSRELAECRESGREITTAVFLRAARGREVASKWKEADEAATGCVLTDLAELVSGGHKFGTIYADPPWKYGNQGTRAATDCHYPTMTLAELKALPVGELAADASHLHLWTTNAFLPESFGLMEAWGFTYKSAFVWVKPQMGIGNYWRVSHEFLLLGVRGKLPFKDKSLMSWLSANRGRHSAKPGKVRSFIERASPGPRLELFGREEVEGWAVWGNEVSRSMFGSSSQGG